MFLNESSTHPHVVSVLRLACHACFYGNNNLYVVNILILPPRSINE